jgi:hypothetical protein
MKLVEWGQIAAFEVFDIPTGCSKCSNDVRTDIGGAVVAINVLFGERHDQAR